MHRKRLDVSCDQCDREELIDHAVVGVILVLFLVAIATWRVVQ